MVASSWQVCSKSSLIFGCSIVLCTAQSDSLNDEYSLDVINWNYTGSRIMLWFFLDFEGADEKHGYLSGQGPIKHWTFEGPNWNVWYPEIY